MSPTSRPADVSGLHDRLLPGVHSFSHFLCGKAAVTHFCITPSYKVPSALLYPKSPKLQSILATRLCSVAQNLTGNPLNTLHCKSYHEWMYAPCVQIAFQMTEMA